MNAGGANDRPIITIRRKFNPRTASSTSWRRLIRSAAAVPVWSATSNDLRSSSSSREWSQPASQGKTAMWPEDEIGRSSAGPWSAPRTTACQTGRSSDATRRLLGHGRRAAAPRPRGAHDQIADRENEQDGAGVVHVLEVVPPALPGAPDLAAEHAEGGDPDDRADRREGDEPQVAHPGHARRVRESRAGERDPPRHDDHRSSVALEPAVGDVDALLGDVQVLPLVLDQLAA